MRLSAIDSFLKHECSNRRELAEHLGVSEVTIGRYIRNEREPDLDTLVKIADYIHVPLDYLLGREEAVSSSSSVVRIPVLGSVQAGIPIEAITNIVDWEDIPSSMTAGGQEYFALRVHGNSMYPRYEEDDVIIIRKQETCETGQDVVALIDGSEATFKRFKRTDRGIILQAINPDFESLAYSNKEVKELPVTILGVVVELRRKF